MILTAKVTRFPELSWEHVKELGERLDQRGYPHPKFTVLEREEEVEVKADD